MRRRRIRKNSDSGVSVGSSVGLNMSENSIDKEIGKDQLTWYPPPVLMLENISLANTAPPVSPTLDCCEPISNHVSDEDSLFNFKITTGLNGRTVNGQLLVVQPEQEPEFRDELSYADSFENDDENERLSSCDGNFTVGWNRFFDGYNLLEVTSEHVIFEGAVLADLSEIYDSLSDVLSEESFELSRDVVSEEEYRFNRCVDVDIKSSKNSSNSFSDFQTEFDKTETDVSPLRAKVEPIFHSLSMDPKSRQISLKGINYPSLQEPELNEMNTRTVSTNYKESPKIKVLQDTKLSPKFKIPKLPLEYSVKNMFQNKQLEEDQLSICISPDLRDDLEKDLSATSSPRTKKYKVSQEKTNKNPVCKTNATAKRYNRIIWDLADDPKPIEKNTALAEKINCDNNADRVNQDFFNSNNKKPTCSKDVYNNSDRVQTRIANKRSNEEINEPPPASPEKYMCWEPPFRNIGINNEKTSVNEKIQLDNNKLPFTATVDERGFSSGTKEFNSFLNPPTADYCMNSLNTNQHFYQNFSNKGNNLYPSNSPKDLNQSKFYYKSATHMNEPNFFSNNPAAGTNNNFFSNNLVANANQQSSYSRNVNQPKDFRRNNSGESNSQWDNFKNNNRWSPPSNNDFNKNHEGGEHSKALTSRNLNIRFCRFYKTCYKYNCNLLHEVPANFKELLLVAHTEDVANIAKELLTKYRDDTPKKDVIPLILNHYSENGNLSDIVSITKVINEWVAVRSTKVYLMEEAIRSIININRTEYDFKKAVAEIIMYNGCNNQSISNILLIIIMKNEDFLMHFWDLIWQLTKYNNRISSNNLNSLLQECIRLDFLSNDIKSIHYRNACKVFENNTFVEVNLEMAVKFLRILEDVGLQECAACIRKFIPNSPSRSYPHDDKNRSVPVPAMSDINVSDRLFDFILQKNVKEVAAIFMEKGHCTNALFEAFASAHKRKAEYNFSLFTFLKEVLKVLDYPRVEENLKQAVETVAFNLLPLYDIQTDYENAANIICLFLDNMQSFISVKNYITIAPYKDNLKNRTEKLVLVFKILIRANVLNVAFTLVKLPEFKLHQNSVPALFDYKMKLVNEFLVNTVKKDRKLSWEVIEYFLKTYPKFSELTNIRKHYSMYLKMQLQCNDENILLTEYNNSIKHHYCIISSDLLRAVVVNLLRVVRAVELEPIYEFCCSQRIYIPHTGLENQITLCKNMTKDEIKLIFEMFFLKALKSNRPASEIKIALTGPVDPSTFPNEVGVFKMPTKCDEGNMLMRLSAALFSFDPPIDITDDPEKLPACIVKNCLERMRRKT